MIKIKNYKKLLYKFKPEYGFVYTFKNNKYKFKNLYLFNYGNK